MEPFFRKIVHPLPKVISIIGLAKNVGKTTALNAIIAYTESIEGLSLGLTSSGLDGEEYDGITGKPKPGIMPPEGSVVATTEFCLQKTNAKYEVIEKTDLRTSLGDVIIVRILSKDYLEVAGPSTVSGLKTVRDKLKNLGCNLIIFDGAINRKASASADISDEIILSTGLNAGFSIEEVRHTTSFWQSIFSLPVWDRFSLPESDAPLSWDEKGNIIAEISKNSLSASSIKECAYLYIPGAFTESAALKLVKLKKMPVIILDEPPSFFITPFVWGRLKKRNNRIFLRKKAPIISITVNPTSSSGNRVPADYFLEYMSEFSHSCDIWDIVSKKGTLKLK